MYFVHGADREQAEEAEAPVQEPVKRKRRESGLLKKVSQPAQLRLSLLNYTLGAGAD